MTSKAKNLTAPGEEPTLTPAQRAELVALVGDLKERGKGLVVAQAKATHAVVTGGMIGDTSKGAEWATQGDYADALGVSDGLISGLKALGKAIALGLGEDHPAWDAVYSQRQSLGKVAAKADRLSTITAEAKRKAKATRSTTSNEEPKDETPEDDGTPEGVFVACEVIRKGIDDLTREDARTLVASLSTLLAEAKARVAAAPVPAKAAKTA